MPSSVPASLAPEIHVLRWPCICHLASHLTFSCLSQWSPVATLELRATPWSYSMMDLCFPALSRTPAEKATTPLACSHVIVLSMAPGPGTCRNAQVPHQLLNKSLDRLDFHFFKASITKGAVTFAVVWQIYTNPCDWEFSTKVKDFPIRSQGFAFFARKLSLKLR